jgi:hypothetical protein
MNNKIKWKIDFYIQISTLWLVRFRFIYVNGDGWLDEVRNEVQTEDPPGQ